MFIKHPVAWNVEKYKLRLDIIFLFSLDLKCSDSSSLGWIEWMKSSPPTAAYLIIQYSILIIIPEQHILGFHRAHLESRNLRFHRAHLESRNLSFHRAYLESRNFSFHKAHLESRNLSFHRAHLESRKLSFHRAHLESRNLNFHKTLPLNTVGVIFKNIDGTFFKRYVYIDIV